MATLRNLSSNCRCHFILFCLTVVLGVCVWTLWFAVNSDRDNVHPLITQLIPAGHCACQTSTTFECSSCLKSFHPISTTTQGLPWQFQYGRDDRNHGLDGSQCRASFPGLFQEIHRASGFWEARHGFSMEDLDAIKLEQGMARAAIYEGELYVITARGKGEDHRRKIMAILSSIYRALMASPDRASRPSIEFVFSVEDKVGDVVGPGYPIWVLARKASEE